MPTTYAIPDGRTVMAASLFTGNSATQTVNNSTNGTSFQPDLVWFKNRSNALEHAILDAVRGGTPPLFLASNSTAAEGSTGGGESITYNSNGFTVISNNQRINFSGYTYVAWQWNAGGTTVTNTSGTISAQVRANATAGFSVVTYSANGSTGTVGHGLGVAPSMIIVKKRNAVERWCVFHVSTSNAYIYLNETNAAETGNANLRFGNNSSVVQPTSTLFTIGSSNDVNGTSGTYVAYCFAAVAGYSAFGSYTGNGSTDGPFVYLGFRPRFLIVKRSDSGAEGWYVTDSSRGSYNLITPYLTANASDAEGSANMQDFLSNGFKIRGSGGYENASGGTYIYMAFAENPFKYANAR